jgi:hypothetical protein
MPAIGACGAPVCPHCGGLNAYECRRPNGLLRFRCRACREDFTITSGTLFAFHKLPLRGYLAAIATFCNEVKGKSALAISRDGADNLSDERQTVGATIQRNDVPRGTMDETSSLWTLVSIALPRSVRESDCSVSSC